MNFLYMKMSCLEPAMTSSESCHIIFKTIPKSCYFRVEVFDDDGKAGLEYISNPWLELPQTLAYVPQTKFKIAWYEDYLQWNINSGISQQPLIRSSSNFKLDFKEPNKYSISLQMKTTFNGRRTQNNKSGISQQQIIRSYSDFNLILCD